MDIAVSYHDTVTKLQGLDLPASSPFDRLEWYALLEQSLFALAERSDDRVVVPLQRHANGLSSLTNWFSFTWRPIGKSQELIRELACDLRSRTHRVTLSPLPDEDGTTEQLRVFIAGEGIGGGWALIRAEGPLTADGGNTKICVRATGDRLALADFNRHRKLHKNFTTADFGDGPIKVTDAMMAIALQRTIAETADELTARGKPPDPELLEHQVHDFVFDYREEDVACKAAADRWNRNVDSCATYVEKLFELGSVGFYPLIHGRGLSKDDDPDPYRFTLLVSPERGWVRILHSNAKGGTVIVGSGVNFEGSEWAAFPE